MLTDKRPHELNLYPVELQHNYFHDPENTRYLLVTSTDTTEMTTKYEVHPVKKVVVALNLNLGPIFECRNL